MIFVHLLLAERLERAQVIVVADRIVQITTGGTHNATALELCRAMRKTWQIVGPNENDDNDDDN